MVSHNDVFRLGVFGRGLGHFENLLAFAHPHPGPDRVCVFDGILARKNIHSPEMRGMPEAPLGLVCMTFFMKGSPGGQACIHDNHRTPDSYSLGLTHGTSGLHVVEDMLDSIGKSVLVIARTP